MSSKAKSSGKAQRSAIADVVTREYTINLHKRVRANRLADYENTSSTDRQVATWG